ncbi:hypothetical protein SUGI_0093460 [Cryptomeria japonica]|nr:hypothetical protein SUGI_0093460 [Cryptomeria japonica]
MEIKTEASKPQEWIRGAIIGAGAFGTVSLAINKSNGELFAVKSMAVNSVSYLENEFNVLKSLDSPHIVKCLAKDYSVENGVEVCNLMMEYLPGGSVADLLSKFGGQLDESVTKSFTRGILRGLDYLHRQGIVHCDIKGKNVLVGGTGLVKLGDFGSARRTEKKGLNGLSGTPLWMAPEVVNQVEQEPASDIWSVGCTVVEMATGRPPWGTASNPLAALYQIGCTDDLPECPSCLSPQGRDFLDKCFRRDPKQRWTAAQLLEHPFLSEIDCCSVTEVNRAPLSPTSTLDFGSPDWDSASSSLCQSVPILSLAIARSCVKGEETGEKNESVKRPSAKDRLAALAVGCEKPDWCSSPPSGHWIVVRSNSPLSNAQNCSAEAESKPVMEISDGEKQEFTHTSSDLEASSEDNQHELEVSSRSITSSLIVDGSQELCEISSNHTSLQKLSPEIQNRVEEREILCDSATQSGPICLTCCIPLVEQFCPQNCEKYERPGIVRANEQLECFIMRADNSVCKLLS